MCAARVLRSCRGFHDRDLGQWLRGSGPEPAQQNIALVDTSPPAVAGPDPVTWNLAYGEPASLRAGSSATELNSQVVINLCESLLLQADCSVAPNLATVEPDGDSAYVVSLRGKATFWVGASVTADDVVYSINRIRDPKNGYSWAMVYDNVASVESVDERHRARHLVPTRRVALDTRVFPPRVPSCKRHSPVIGRILAHTGLGRNPHRVVPYLTDDAVTRKGRNVERGKTVDVLTSPATDYTHRLVASVPGRSRSEQKGHS